MVLYTPSFAQCFFTFRFYNLFLSFFVAMDLEATPSIPRSYPLCRVKGSLDTPLSLQGIFKGMERKVNNANAVEEQFDAGR